MSPQLQYSFGSPFEQQLPAGARRVGLGLTPNRETVMWIIVGLVVLPACRESWMGDGGATCLLGKLDGRRTRRSEEQAGESENGGGHTSAYSPCSAGTDDGLTRNDHEGSNFAGFAATQVEGTALVAYSFSLLFVVC